MNPSTTRRAGVLAIASGVGIAFVGYLGFVASSPAPVWAPSVMASGMLVYAWGIVAAVPAKYRRIARIGAIVGTIWTGGVAVAFTVILVRISN